ncbi:MAG: hypothetical protein SCAL_001028 [Candidatus Syntrophoarchaeum caldarius]|uniref:Uncharacterized protein n=1 Tax=Candidatus Syntropharchaeum caldarium TaxID=1838285 RepID=A0A1F2P8Z4_9EURY|nr:MAG: hypothetical protein SCAL_001028 [Candidatus Syntrophoarchaeum caldarius]
MHQVNIQSVLKNIVSCVSIMQVIPDTGEREKNSG